MGGGRLAADLWSPLPTTIVRHREIEEGNVGAWRAAPGWDWTIWVAEESRPGRLTARKGPMDQDFREAGVGCN